MFVWLLVQTVALLLAAQRVPLATGTAGYPEPPEQLAAHVMLAAQIAGSALLFPFLMRTRASAVMSVATAWPYQLLAGYLSARPAMQMLAASTYVTLWLVALSVWQASLRTSRAQRVGVALAGGLAVGGAILWYLAAEFAPPLSSTVFPNPGSYGPLTSALALLEGSNTVDESAESSQLVWKGDARVWFWPAAILGSGLGAWHWALRRHRRHMTPPRPDDRTGASGN